MLDMYRVNLDINSAKCQSLGMPFFPENVDTSNLTKEQVEAYSDYRQSSSLVSLDNIYNTIYDCLTSATKDSFGFEFLMERINLKTYKFLGMDIDEDFRAVIPMPSCTVIVGSLFNKEQLLYELADEDALLYYKGDKEAVRKEIEDLDEAQVRRFVTALKTGKLYDMGGADKSELKVPDLISLTSMCYSDSVVSESTKDAFSSITLSIINKKKYDDMKEVGVRSDTMDKAKTHGGVLAILFATWQNLVKQYNAIYSVLGNLDLWSNAYKKIVGESEYYKMMGNSIKVIDSFNGNLDDINMVSFNGVTKNGGFLDANIVRSQCGDCLEALKTLCVRNNNASFDFEGFLVGCVDTDISTDIYSLPLEELQSLSIIDSLSYIDEDINNAKESYDMSSPEDRALYTKSIIKSYEKEFKEFRPTQKHKITDAMADFVERSVVDPTMVDVDGKPIKASDITTATAREIDIAQFKKDLIRVLKLLDKALVRVKKGF